MITYNRLWDLMKDRGITTYALIHKFGISANQINRWKHGEDMKLSTLNNLCTILNCEPSDILRYSRDELSSVVLRDREILYVSEQEKKRTIFSKESSKKREKRPSNQLSENLNRLLKERHMLPRELADLSGVPLPTIRNIQYAKTKNPRTDTLSAIANVLGISIAELVG